VTTSWWWHQVNTRGRVLLILGLVWMGIGLDVALDPVPPGWENIWLFTHVPAEWRAGAWFLTGFLAIIVGLRRRNTEDDGFGFAALYLMPAERAAAFLYGYMDYLLPFGGPGAPGGLLDALIYVAIVALILVLSDWANPPAPLPGAEP
jgi:hypothetical protein